ncbi:hypothetical protein CFP56_041412 [Quercus suber]|uniref:DC1 domain-containing protein n=1 Tax=Quercus suber TaxID=58331 RepID=A0AAW0IVA8_QUESU
MEQQQQQQLLHFCDSKHPLVFNPNDMRGGAICCGCQESIYGPYYCCPEDGCPWFFHHKACAEVALGLHHPLHPIHPLILFDDKTLYPEHKQKTKCRIDYDKHIQFSNCLLCNESRNQHTYRCFRCDFNLHFTCATLPLIMEPEFHDHPLTPIWKWITFTCDICGKEDKDKGMPYMCQPCGLWIHRTCASFPRRVKVVRHKHLLHLTHSSLQFHQSDSRFCQICVQKVDTRYGLYYCSRCDFVAHLNCALDSRNKENINLKEFKDVDEVPELNESADSATYEVKKSNMKEDGTQIVEEIKHISHEHDLKLTNEVPNNQICDGCEKEPFSLRIIVVFFLHESCAKLPPKKRHPLHQHPLILLPMEPSKYFRCRACSQYCNGFTYKCEKCWFHLDVQCSLISDILTHEGHEHPLILSYITDKQKCSCCSNESDQVFRCTSCEFALDYKCATLPHTTRYNQHEHLFTLCYRLEDDSVILLIPNVFLGHTQIASFEVLRHLIATHTPLLSLRKLKTTHHVTYVIVLVNILSINVSHILMLYYLLQPLKVIAWVAEYSLDIQVLTSSPLIHTNAMQDLQRKRLVTCPCSHGIIPCSLARLRDATKELGIGKRQIHGAQVVLYKGLVNAALK